MRSLPDYAKKSDSISIVAQKLLVSNLINAVSSKGEVHAIAFCSLKAMPLTDSLSHLYGCKIERLALKNRNPLNKLSTPQDEHAYRHFDSLNLINVTKTFLLAEDKDYNIYYKPINMAMPICSNCHGTNINPTSAEAIASLYPEDKATGFEQGRLRGMWKITFPKPQKAKSR